MKIGYYPGKHIRNNVSVFLEEHAREQPNKVAFYFLSGDDLQSGSFSHQTIAYAELNRKVAIFSDILLQAGIRMGDRVIVFAPISPELYIAIASLQRIGAIPVLLDSWSRQEQLVSIIQNSKPSGVITPSLWLRALEKNLEGFDIRIKIVIDDPEFKKEIIPLTNLPEEKNGVAPVNQDDTALITYTTGSSGTPKGANRTHRFLAAQHYALKRLFPYKENDVDLPVFPVFALNNIASGITTVIPAINISKPDQNDPKTLISQIIKCKVNCMTLAPSSFRNLAIYCAAEGVLLNGISRVLTGGAPISEIDVLRFMKIAPNSKNWILYGSTEVEPIAYIESREMVSIKPPKWTNSTKVGVNVGRIDAALRYELIDIETDNLSLEVDIKKTEVSDDEVGELIVAGEHVCAGYYKNEEAFARTKIKDQDGTIWHRTGDLARVDGDGYLWIVGRKHNVIKSGNQYFFPVRPEILMKDLPFVLNAAYLNFDDNSEGKVVAVVTLKEKGEKKLGGYCEDIKEIFKKEKLPLNEVVFMEEIPMDVRHHSKVNYSKLRQKLHEIYR